MKRAVYPKKKKRERDLIAGNSTSWSWLPYKQPPEKAATEVLTSP